MKILRNRRNAIIISVAVAIVAVLFGVHRSLTGLARDTEAVFFQGAVYDGYKHPSIDSQLKNQTDAALGIVTIAGNYETLAVQARELDAARSELLHAVGVSDRGYASLRMLFAFDDLRYAYTAVDMSERDREAIEDYISTFQGAWNVIESERERYNEAVSQFIDGKSYSVIAGVIGQLVPVEPPELFINYQS